MKLDNAKENLDGFLESYDDLGVAKRFYIDLGELYINYSEMGDLVFL